MKVEGPIEQLLYSTVRLEVRGDAGAGAGTAFIFGYVQEGRTLLTLVTNKHVISEAHTGEFFFTLHNKDGPDVGSRFNVGMDQFNRRWYLHPSPDVDLAAMPLKPVMDIIEKAGKTVFVKTIPHTLIPTEEQLRELDALEEVVFIGYPSGLYDSVNLVPIIRRGTTATPPYLDYEGKPQFLIDASVFPGSSGSPVLIVNAGGYSTRGGFVVGSRAYLLGVLSEVLFRHEEGSLQFQSIPTAVRPVVTTKEMLDLGIVTKSCLVMETIMGLVSAVGPPSKPEPPTALVAD